MLVVRKLCNRIGVSSVVGPSGLSQVTDRIEPSRGRSGSCERCVGEYINVERARRRSLRVAATENSPLTVRRLLRKSDARWSPSIRRRVSRVSRCRRARRFGDPKVVAASKCVVPAKRPTDPCQAVTARASSQLARSTAHGLRTLNHSQATGPPATMRAMNARSSATIASVTRRKLIA
jgi:hypothetical protein